MKKTFCCLLVLSVAAAGYGKVSTSKPMAGKNRIKITNSLGMPIKVVLFPFREAVISANIDTTIKEYKFKEGANFSKGDIIALLDDRIYRQLFFKAEAALAETETNLRFAQRNYKRDQDLYKKGIRGRDELEKSELEQQICESKIKYAAANMQNAQLNLNFCTILAPFDGRLVSKMLQEHEYVRTGQPFMCIIDDNNLLAAMHLPAKMINSIREGQSVVIKMDETGNLHEGSVYQTSGRIDPGSRTFEIKALIHNQDHTLSAGMSGTLIEINDAPKATHKEKLPF